MMNQWNLIELKGLWIEQEGRNHKKLSGQVKLCCCMMTYVNKVISYLH